MSKVKDLLRQHYLIAIALLILSLIRFTSAVPVLFVADSMKFISPEDLIRMRDFDSIWSILNFSIFERVLNYYIQIWNNNDLSWSITINKISSILSTLLVYLIVFRSTKAYYLSLITAIIFSLNPALLYIEQVVMAEANFIFFVLLITSLLQVILLESKTTNLVKASILSLIAGLIAGLAALTKQTADNWIIFVFIVLMLIGIYQFLKSKKRYFIIVASVFFLSSFIVKVPVYWGNYNSFGTFDPMLSRTVDSGRGGFLWSLTEEMVYANPSTSYPWLTQAIIQTTENFKSNFAIDDKSSVTSPFYMAISAINVAGREGRLINPETGMAISMEEWPTICSKYWFDLCFYQPLKLAKRIFQKSLVNMFLKEDLGLFVFENSLRPQVNFQPIQYTKVPFSFKDQFDPRLFGLRAERLSVSTSEITKVHDFYSYFKLVSSPNDYWIMINMDTPYAFRAPLASVSLWWQKIWAWLPWIYFIAPLFLVSLTIYLWKRKFTLFDLFILGSCAYYIGLPLLFSHAEPRYRLQFIHFMLIFIAISFPRRHNKD